MRPFQLSQSNRSALRIRVSPSARSSATGPQGSRCPPRFAELLLQHLAVSSGKLVECHLGAMARAPGRLQVSNEGQQPSSS
jgi:hypothetical protein